METTYQPKALSADELNQLSQEVKQVLTELYGDRLNRVILYGSYARGDFHAESDVDYMVVLNDTDFRQTKEFDKYWNFIWDAWNRHGIWISLKVAFKDRLAASDLFFYRNVRAEGLLV